MLPIFSELLKMWADLGCELPIEEGRYWLDNNFILGFTHDGNLVKLYKYKVDDDLNISLKPYDDKMKICNREYETWEQTLERNSERLLALETESIAFIRRIIDDYKDYDKYILTSTGKDSTVALDLVHRVDSSIPVVFNNTSLDCADTYRIVNRHKDWIVTNPKVGFYKWVTEQKYVPTRLSRVCCGIYKEEITVDYFDKTTDKALWFMGVRNAESLTRRDREDIIKNPKWGTRNWFGCLPIRKWFDFDVWLYIFKYGLEINPKYRKGYGRVGCGIACPYATKYTWCLDEYWYPKMRARWLSILNKDFVENTRWVRLNCTIDEYKKCWNGGLYRPEPTEDVINEFMEYKGITDREVALQYFNKSCCNCGKNVRQSDTLAMNLKMNGRTTNKIYCKKCLMKELGMTKEQWDDCTADFKSQGCKLF